MPRLDDIYYKVDHELVDNGFYEVDDEGKKQLIDSALKHFISAKITEFDSTKTLPDSAKEELSVNDLAEMLGTVIPQEDHFDTIRHLTHYVLAVASGLQGWTIVWDGDNSEEFLDNPLAKFNEAGYWDGLTTHEQTSYVQTFEFAHDILNQVILNKEKKQPALTYTKSQLLKGDK